MQDAIGAIGTWPCWNTPQDGGWSADRLDAARAYAADIGSAAVMLVSGGRVVSAWGEVTTRYNTHSIRKSLLSALIGIHEAEGRIDLEATLAALGIDDREGLTERERRATVHELLAARSGVYHPSGYETDSMIAAKPARHTAGPGTHWCYNNWDFNALGTIFRQCTGADIHQDFATRIGLPCGLEDFRPETDGQMIALDASIHPAYPFRMTARDLARIGELYLRQGRAQGRQIVPADWVATSVLPYSDAGLSGAYGYMWWVERAGILFPNVILPAGSYAAKGAGGHVVLVIPALDAVIVHRVNTDIKGNAVSKGRIGRLFAMMLRARV